MKYTCRNSGCYMFKNLIPTSTTGIPGQYVYSEPVQYHCYQVTGDRVASSCSDRGEDWRYTYKQISKIISGIAKDYRENKTVIFWSTTRREGPSERGAREGLLEEGLLSLEGVTTLPGRGRSKVQGFRREQAWPVWEPEPSQCPRAQGTQAG